MDKFIKCREDCDFVACGATEEEVFRKAEDHARTVHGLKEISSEDKARAREIMQEGYCDPAEGIAPCESFTPCLDACFDDCGEACCC